MAHNPENINNFSTNNVESFENNKTKKTNKYLKKAIALGLGVSITASSMFLTGCGNETKGENLPGPDFQVEKFEDNQNVFISATALGEKSFIEKYGEQYANPESTYGALVAYEKANNGRSILINPDYIKYYYATEKPGVKNGDVSQLGFEDVKLQVSDLDQEKAMKFFDDYIIDQMDLCANFLAFNPGASEVIEDQFLTYCGQEGYSDKGFVGYVDQTKMLFDYIASYATNYNQIAYFETDKSTTDVNSPDGTYIGRFTPDMDNSGVAEMNIMPSLKVHQFENNDTKTIYFSPLEQSSVVVTISQERILDQSNNVQLTNGTSLGIATIL